MKHLPLYIFLAAVLLAVQSCSEDDKESRITGYNFSVSSLNEGDADNTQMITVTASGEFGDPVTVSYRIEAGTAVADEDFTASSGEVTFTSSERTADIPLTIKGDKYFELGETISLFMDTDFFRVVHTITIRNDDGMPDIDQDDEGYLTPDTYPSMSKVWADEFSGASLNETDWNYELGDGCDRGICGWGNEELQSYTNDNENVRLVDGKLIITAQEEAGDNYTSARITTQDKQEIRFGRIDIRAKSPKGQGIWPALWMLGANIDQVNWPSCGEIDIMEIVGHEPDKVHGTVHYDNGGYATSTGSYSLSSGDFSDQFHVYTLVWEPDRMTWYIDNQEYRSFARSGSGTYPFNSPFFFIFNVAVGGRWPGYPDETTVFPQSMEVDYIRVFQ